MERPPCSRCTRPATVSLSALWSTLGIRPRRQKLSRSISLCTACAHALLDFLAASPLHSLHQSLSAAYTSVQNHLGESCHPENNTTTTLSTEDHHGSNHAAASCRPCLTACNSRQIDEDDGVSPAPRSGAGA